ncbi:AAA family ATPase [Colwellia sp. RSH04]|uniref:AAA family ATPase n=1 Tax=Colwellia sp. RSH04 TaxID=2305464 RepID=UPI000E581D36|nr:AAA family ATPase [Colwellia sp. RSH04]RHW76468.1 AAA family ATPase [Colwellia sp. RSH04]
MTKTVKSIVTFEHEITKDLGVTMDIKQLDTYLLNALAQYCGRNPELFQKIRTKDDEGLYQACALTILHACKFMPKSIADKFVFNIKPKAPFGFDFDFKKEIPLEKEEVSVAMKKATIEIESYFWEFNASSFIKIVRNAVNKVPKQGTKFSAINAINKVIYELDEHQNELKRQYNNGYGEIIPFDEAPGFEETLIIEDTPYAPENGSWAQGFIDTPILFDMSTREFLSHSAIEMKQLINQSCWTACAESIKEGLLTTTLNAKTTSHDGKAISKKLSTVTPSLLLTSIFGSPLMIEFFATAFGINKNEVQFPPNIYSQRAELMNYVETKTFESNENGQRREINWLAKAEEQKSLLTLTNECQAFLGAFFSERNDESLHKRMNYLTKENSWRTIGKELGQFIRLNTGNRQSKVQKLSTVKSINYQLNSQVLGQPQAVESVCNAVSSMLFKQSDTHLGVSTFLGTSGVGKTFLAEKLAEALNLNMNVGYTTKVINMEQYIEVKDVMKLWGSGSQYVNSEMGELSMAVAKQPRQIIVFDEIEKAHPALVQSLLTLIDKGKAKDRTSQQEVDFSLCYFVFTTNLGSQTIGRLNDLEVDVEDLLSNTASHSSLSSEMVNRLAAGNIVLFKQLSAVEMIRLASTAKDAFIRTSAVDWCGKLPELMIETLGGEVTPRNIKTQAEKLENTILSKAMNILPEENFSKLDNISVSVLEDVAKENKKIILFSNDKPLCDFISEKGVTCLSTNSVDDIEFGLCIPADGYIFDEKSITIPPQHLITLLKNNPDSLCFGLFKNSESVLAKCNYHENIFTHYFIIPRRTKRIINELLAETTREIHLINNLTQQMSRNMKANYCIEVTETDNGVKALFKGFEYRCAIGQDDFLPFLTFDGAPNVSFNDVQGLDGAKQDLKLVSNAMNNTDYLKNRNTEIPKGCVFSGHPGTGKTMLAKALATECDVSFFSVNSADLLGGNPVQNINDLFDVAEKNAPAILFLDEVDAIAQSREKGSELTRMAVNTLLVRLDGFKSTEQPVFVAAATNHPQLLDRALLRSGRLEKHIYCDLPNGDIRKTYIKQHLNASNCQIDDQSLSELTKMTSGCSIAVLARIIRESFYTEIKTEIPWSVDMLIEEVRTAKFGDIRTDMTQAKADIKSTAYHEAGHLVAHKILFPEAKVELASVQPRGAALGMIVPGENASTGSINKRRIKHHLQVLLAGLAVEHLKGFVGDDSLSGASDDRMKATNLAKRAITEWGMSDLFGLAIPSQLAMTPSDITTEVNSWLSEAFDSVTMLLEDNKQLLTTVAETLIKRETLNSTEIDELFLNRSDAQMIQLAS